MPPLTQLLASTKLEGFYSVLNSQISSKEGREAEEMAKEKGEAKEMKKSSKVEYQLHLEHQNLIDTLEFSSNNLASP